MDRRPTIPALAAAALALALLPAAAGAQSGPFGDPLTAPANTTFGCDAVPRLDPGASGNYVLLPSGQTTCTYWEIGAFGGGGATGYAPASGTVTRVRVKSGATPAPLRITILRQISTLLPDGRIGESSCCFGVAESAPFQPGANTVTEQTVNLPVENVRLPDQNIAWADIVGVSGVGPGSLPLSQTGPSTIDSATTPGVPTAAYVYPKFQPDQAPRTDVSGVPNALVLLQFDWCPAAAAGRATLRQGCSRAGGGTVPGGTSPSGTAPTTGPAASAPATIRSTALRLNGRRVALRVACAATSRCRGRVRLRTRGSKPRTLGSAKLSLAAGRSATIKVLLGASARRSVRRRARTPVRIEVDLGTGGKVARNVTLRR